MTLTYEIRDELSRAQPGNDQARRAQLATILRLSSTLRVARSDDGSPIRSLCVHLPAASLARTVRSQIADLHSIPSWALEINNTGLRKGAKYEVRVAEARRLIKSANLLDAKDRAILGLPVYISGGSPSVLIAAWRGAFLVTGSLKGPRGGSVMEVRCPSPEAAYSLASCARRLGLNPITREARGIHRAQLRDPREISIVLGLLGATASQTQWDRLVSREDTYGKAVTLDRLEAVNRRKSLLAAAATVRKVERALEILNGQAPEHLWEAGKLRIEHPDYSLEELGQIADPPATKDTMTGRLRRLLMQADQIAQIRGIEGTEPVSARSAASVKAI